MIKTFTLQVSLDHLVKPDRVDSLDLPVRRDSAERLGRADPPDPQDPAESEENPDNPDPPVNQDHLDLAVNLDLLDHKDLLDLRLAGTCLFSIRCTKSVQIPVPR